MKLNWNLSWPSPDDLKVWFTATPIGMFYVEEWRKCSNGNYDKPSKRNDDEEYVYRYTGLTGYFTTPEEAMQSLENEIFSKAITTLYLFR